MVQEVSRGQDTEVGLQAQLMNYVEEMMVETDYQVYQRTGQVLPKKIIDLRLAGRGGMNKHGYH